MKLWIYKYIMGISDIKDGEVKEFETLSDFLNFIKDKKVSVNEIYDWVKVEVVRRYGIQEFTKCDYSIVIITEEEIK